MKNDTTKTLLLLALAPCANACGEFYRQFAADVPVNTSPTKP